MHNFAASFPAAGVLARHLEQGTELTDPDLKYLYCMMQGYDKHHLAATLKLYKPTPRGHWIHTGYPGSGKSMVTILTVLPMFLQRVDCEDLNGIFQHNPDPLPYRRTGIRSNEQRSSPEWTDDDVPEWWNDEPLMFELPEPFSASIVYEHLLPKVLCSVNTLHSIIMCSE